MQRTLWHNLIRKLLLLPVLSLIGADVFAIDDTELVAQLQGNAIAKYAATGAISYADLSVSPFVTSTLTTQNIISLKVKEDGDYIGIPIDATVQIKIEYKNLAGVQQTAINKDLTVTYNPKGGTKYNAEQYFVLSNGTDVNVTVTDDVTFNNGTLAAGKAFLVLTNRLQSSRDYVFDPVIYPANARANPVLVAKTWQTPDELMLEWDAPLVNNGTDVDIEWAWVNISDATVADEYKTGGSYDPEKIFTDNSSRVTVPWNYLSTLTPNFKIPLLYESGGIIFFRVRFAQLTKSGDRITGNWNTSASSVTAVAGHWQYAFNADDNAYRNNGHMPEMNWQATTSYAEDGKRKTVISYFDGTLRTRQTVTKDNSVTTQKAGLTVSAPTTVVAETMYDYQGRPVIQILPAPTISNLIEYTHQVNSFAGVNPGALPKEVYDIFNGSVCAAAAPLLIATAPTGPAATTAYGASNYYSPENPLVKGITGKLMDPYIPNANGRPYTETRYAMDGSGRVDAQSGVGEAHKLGSGHETKYIYTQPDQNELDGLFGTDAGDRSHYFKTLVKDANGQYSVSYTDMYGKTIATALAGENPASLEKLPSLQTKLTADGRFGQIQKDLLASNVAKDESIESVSSVVLTKAGTATFNYTMDPQKLLFDKCAGATPVVKVCYDCKYNLEITVASTCGGSYTVHNPSSSPVDQSGSLPYTFKSPVFDLSGLQNTNCTSDNPNIAVQFSMTLPEGEFIVTKRLVLNTAARDWYLNNVVLNPLNINNSICKSELEFKTEIEARLQLQGAGCEMDCANCNLALGITLPATPGTIATARENFISSSLLASDLASTPERRASIGAAFDQQLEVCNNVCTGTLFFPEELQTIREQMLADMTPTGGQYARLNELKAENQVYDNANNDFEKDAITGANIPNTDHTLKPFNIFNAGMQGGAAYLLKLKRDDPGGYFYYGQNGQVDIAVHSSTTTPNYAILDGLSYEGFAAKFKTEWAKTLLPYHPEYKRLEFAERVLPAIYSFNTELFSVDDFAGAVAKNWISGTAGSGYSIINIDPFTGITGSLFGTAMAGLITNYNLDRKNLDGSPGSFPAIAMWQAATTSVFPDVATAPVIINGEQLLASALCPADKNKIWRAFRSLYTTERKQLIYNFLNSQVPLDAGVLTEINRAGNHYVERFMDVNRLAGIVGSGGGTTGYVEVELEKQYRDIALSYVPRWRATLLRCESISSSQNFSSDAAREAFIKGITDELVKICWAGSDDEHPVGASSCPALVVSRNGLTIGNNYLSFDAAISAKMAVLLTNPQTPACNSFIIDWPKPHDFPVVFSEEIVDSKDECLCTRLTHLRTAATTQLYPVTNAGLVNYLHEWYQVDVPEATIASLLAVCNPAADCQTINPPVMIPPLLQCGYNYLASCIDCEQMRTVDQQFRTAFPNRLLFGPFADPNEPDNITATPLTADQIALRHAANRFYANYINQKLGFNKTWAEYFQFMADCGIPCVSGIAEGGTSTPAEDYNCSEARRILKRYFDIYANTQGIIETDLVTLAGNLTPDEGNKGVFNVNGELIDQTNASDPHHVKLEVVDIWNSDPANDAIGTLSLLPNERFGLQLKPNKVFPCKGIVAMRFYEFETDGDVDGIMSTPGSFIDFGDGTKIPFEASATSLPNTVVHILPQSAVVGPFAQDLSQLHVGYARHHYTVPISHTVTVYHTDMLGFVGFDNYEGSSEQLIQYRNLEGYFPQQTLSIGFKSTQVASFNTFSKIFNFSTITGLQHFWYGSGDGWVTPFQENHLSMAGPNGGLHKDIKAIQIGYHWQATPGTGIQSLLQTFPQWNTDYKEIQNISINNFGTHITPTTHFYFPKLQCLEITMAGETSLQSEIDRVLTEVATYSTQNNGFIRIGNNSYSYATPGLPAIQALRNRGWLIVGNAIEGTPGFDRELTQSERDFLLREFPAIQAGIELPVATNFSRFFNAVSGTRFTPAELDAIYAGCGTSLNTCQAPPEQSPYNCKRLCDHSAVPPPADDPLDCDGEQDLLALNLAEEAYAEYVQSARNNFINSWNKKCLQVAGLETFTVTHEQDEYHYTLYYYDQGGNLVKTVPPAGVRPHFYGNLSDPDDFLKKVKISRAAGTNSVPNIDHTLYTRYLYNSLNQVVIQKTPDAGVSKFYYDALGRLVVSQNAKQATTTKYSYTLYDPLGRIAEVGEKSGAGAIDQPRAQTDFSGWFAIGANKQITRTIYDNPYGPIFSKLAQQNMRSRVSCVQVWNDDFPASKYKAATFYSYDIHGNVDILLQDFGEGSSMEVAGNQHKRIEYKYDLVSGKVNEVAYQPGWADGFYHRYQYDAENRLTNVETSRDKILWQIDAGYQYYRHGPLARTELGALKVQGVDYAYTLQGWLKAINPGSTSKTGGNCPPDIGAPDILLLNDRGIQPPDFNAAPPQYLASKEIVFNAAFESLITDNWETQINVNAGCNADPNAVDLYDNDGITSNRVARDAYMLSLNYYNQGSLTDYTPIQAIKPSALAPGLLGADNHPLFNGNISSMAVNIRKLTTLSATGSIAAGPVLYNYRYDQLNRITKMDAFAAVNSDYASLTTLGDTYKERIGYDPNGNILTYIRNGDAARPAMDDLTYHYQAGSNKLNYVADVALDVTIPDYKKYNDIKQGQANGNYQYDEIGNLVYDDKGDITSITWTVYGKINTITKRDGTGITYTYDASGNRIGKAVTKTGTTTETWYVRDATGNTMAVYEAIRPAGVQNGNLTQKEVHLYGSSRLGIINYALNCNTNSGPATLTGSWDATLTRGDKLFELTNHLGNVLATVTDRRVAVQEGATTNVDYYLPDVATATDYYPFGMAMPGRTYSANS
ncbi:MAG: hypothetical protein V4722_06940, partial [Bacteroidota bacterium]